MSVVFVLQRSRLLKPKFTRRQQTVAHALALGPLDYQKKILLIYRFHIIIKARL